MSLGWYVLQVYSGKEDLVKNGIAYKIALGELDGVEEVVIPMHKEVVFKDGKKKVVEKKSFPGYVYIRLDMNMKRKGLIESVPHVFRFVKEEGVDLPIPLQESEYMSLVEGGKEGSVTSEEYRGYGDFDLGQRVVIIDGPFSGFVGVVKELQEERRKFIVNVEIFGRMTPVEIDYFKVKKA